MEAKRIGEYLLEQHRLSQKQIDRALEIQAGKLEGGHMPPIGTVLVSMGAVTNDDIAFALEQQERDRMRMPA